MYNLNGETQNYTGWLPGEEETHQTGRGKMLRVRDFVDARLYEDEEAVIQDALRYLLRARADLRIQLAVHRYQTKEISLAKAASLAGVSWAQMKDILVERGIQPCLGLETMEEAEEEVRTLRDYFEGQP